jgi:biopolymer transport protein ExbD
MPVHAPGPRLYNSIPFKHLAQVGGHAGGKNANIHLNLTPFVDMMTILVTFLLMVFSATGELLVQQPGLELPAARQQDDIQRAPVITISQQAITFNNQHIAETLSVLNDDSPNWKVVELFEKMKFEHNRFRAKFDDLPDSEKQRCLEPNPDDKLKCLDGLAILQADKGVAAKVINRVLKTANAAGYNNIMFAVKRRGGS